MILLLYIDQLRPDRQTEGEEGAAGNISDSFTSNIFSPLAELGLLGQLEDK